MSLLGGFRTDQQITALLAESDPNSRRAMNLMERLKRAGPKVIPKLIDALALSDKSRTMMFVDILTALVNDRTLAEFREGLADGNERVVKGTAWALSGSTDYNANTLLEWFKDSEVSKAALIEVLRVHKQDLSVHELLQAAYDLDTREKAAVFRIIEDIIRPEMVPDLVARMGGKDPIVKIHLIHLLGASTPKISITRSNSASGSEQDGAQRRVGRPRVAGPAMSTSRLSRNCSRIRTSTSRRKPSIWWSRSGTRIRSYSWPMR